MRAEKMRPVIGSRWRHKKRGTVYTVQGFGQCQVDDNPLDMAEMVIYFDASKAWVRPVSEFLDGRFVPEENRK